MRHGHSSTSGSSQHRDKRLFQPSITSFFSSEHDDEGTSSAAHPAPAWPKTTPKQRAPAFPSVPGTVQSDLLSVGMRVRKSVPEGYKTHKTLGLPSIQTTMSTTSHRSHKSTTTTTSATAHVSSASPPREPVPSALQHQRELLPFCGLHKIGGYAEQPVNGGDVPVNLFPLPPEAFNQPFSSQSSTSSFVSTESAPQNPANLHKRSWQADDDDENVLPSDFTSSKFIFAHPMKIAEDDAPVSPLSDTPAPTFGGALRPFAQPKSRKQGRGRGVDVDAGFLKEVDMEMVENVMQGEESLPEESVSDFGEAPFLQPWSSPLREVEMGGV